MPLCPIPKRYWISDVDREWQRDGRERGRFTVEADYRHRLREYDEGNNRFGPIEYVYGIEWIERAWVQIT